MHDPDCPYAGTPVPPTADCPGCGAAQDEASLWPVYERETTPDLWDELHLGERYL